MLIALCMNAFAPMVFAQSVMLGTKEVAVHGFFQQGFVVTDDNNFLTMETTNGSAAMTDGAINLSSNLTRKLRVGAQLYARNIGELGNGSPQIDWALADYKFSSHFGVRAGKMKTVLGLFTDTQDAEFLYTWALLPQGTYPLDLRSLSIAHVGAEVYGSAKLGTASSVAYTGFYGMIPDDIRGGYRYSLEDGGTAYRSKAHNKGGGFDTRWTTPVAGLVTGYSFMQTKVEVDLVARGLGDFSATVEPSRHHAAYVDYQGARVRLNGEMRSDLVRVEVTPAFTPTTTTRSRAWFATASYRLSDKLEVGTYYSHFQYDTAVESSLPDNHIYDRAVTARVDINRFWNVKVEAHFMDGTGNLTLARGFYYRNNTSGFDSTTNMLVVRTGVNF